MSELKFYFIDAENYSIYSENDEKLGCLRVRQGRWYFHPEIFCGEAVYLTDEELVAILAKQASLNKNKCVIVVGS